MGWKLFTAMIALPGFAEIYGAYKLIPYVRTKGGLLPFLFCFLSGIFDLGFSAVMTLILYLELPLVLVVTLDNLIVLSIVAFLISTFLLWRTANAMISLWFAGVLKEGLIRRVIGVGITVEANSTDNT